MTGLAFGGEITLRVQALSSNENQKIMGYVEYFNYLCTSVYHQNYAIMRINILSAFLLCLGLMGMAQSKNLCPDNNHPHMIDLGLPSGTKWACCNVGATNPQSHGNYYAWGETYTKTSYLWQDYAYGSNRDNCRHLNYDIAGSGYDVARQKWGGSWQMPSSMQVKELKDKCTCVWTTYNGVKGALITGPNRNKIFLPAAGGVTGKDKTLVGFNGQYWSSSQSYGDAYTMTVSKASFDLHSEARLFGFPVRPVVENDQVLTFDVKGEDGLSAKAKLDIKQQKVTLLNGSPRSVNYKYSKAYQSDDENLSDIERLSSMVMILSEKNYALQSFETMTVDMMEGKFGDCCIFVSDGLILYNGNYQNSIKTAKAESQTEYLKELINAIVALTESKSQSEPAATTSSQATQPASKPAATPSSQTTQPVSKPAATPSSQTTQPASKPAATPSSQTTQPASKQSDSGYNDEEPTLTVIDSEGGVVSLLISLDNKEINLYWDHFIERINYKYFIIDDTDQELGDLVIMSSKLPSKRVRKNLAKDTQKGKYGDCFIIDNNSVIIYIKDGKKGQYEPVIEQSLVNMVAALKKRYQRDN